MKACWIWFSHVHNRLVLVRNPVKRMVNPTYTVWVYEDDGSIQDVYEQPMGYFFDAHTYIGRL